MRLGFRHFHAYSKYPTMTVFHNAVGYQQCGVDDFQQFNIVLPLVAEIEQITESVSNFKRDLFQFGFRRIQLVVIQFAIRRGYLCPADIETVKVFFRPG